MFNFFLNSFDQNVNTSLQLNFRSTHEQMIEPDTGVSPDGVLNLIPIAVAMFMSQTQQHNVSLLREVLRLLDGIQDHLV